MAQHTNPQTPQSEKHPITRRSGPGRIDPEYGRELLDKSGRSSHDETERAFLRHPRAADELAENLGENFVDAATGGDDPEIERRERISEAERGGPYVASPAGREFAAGTDESNPEDAEAEPFPTT